MRASGASSTCPAGPGHVLYLNSELTGNRWHIYADNIAMARWLQSTVQGMLNPETADTSIPVTEAQFTKSGDPRYFWTERVKCAGRGDRPHLVSDRRAAADPHPAQRRSGPPLRGVHASDPGARRTPDAETASKRPAGRGRESAKDDPSAPARWPFPRAGPRLGNTFCRVVGHCERYRSR